MRWSHVMMWCSVWAMTGCGGCGETVEPEETVSLTCEETCLQGRRSYNKELCIGECEISDTITVTSCDKLCDAEQERVDTQNAFVCRHRCTQDSDGDGVYANADRCPETAAGAPVNAQGCVDSDGDGVGDDEDACPSQGGTEIAVNGCPYVAPSCPGGHCVNHEPPTCTGTGCDRELEVPLMKMIPEPTRLALARQFLSLRPTRQLCLSTNQGPRSPRMVEPPVGLNEQAYQGGDYLTSAVYFHVEDDTLIPLPDDDTSTAATRGAGPNQVVDIPVEFASVEAACPPVQYSLSVDYYFCETLPGVEERAHYHELGFCTWTPLDYISGVQPDVPFFYPLDQAGLFAQLYQPLMKNPAFSGSLSYLPSGKAALYYRTLWLRFQVIAHDGNGQPSPIGMHTDASYVVLYTQAKRYELTRIPSEGF